MQRPAYPPGALPAKYLPEVACRWRGCSIQDSDLHEARIAFEKTRPELRKDQLLRHAQTGHTGSFCHWAGCQPDQRIDDLQKHLATHILPYRCRLCYNPAYGGTMVFAEGQALEDHWRHQHPNSPLPIYPCSVFCANRERFHDIEQLATHSLEHHPALQSCPMAFRSTTGGACREKRNPLQLMTHIWQQHGDNAYAVESGRSIRNDAQESEIHQIVDRFYGPGTIARILAAYHTAQIQHAPPHEAIILVSPPAGAGSTYRAVAPRTPPFAHPQQPFAVQHRSHLQSPNVGPTAVQLYGPASANSSWQQVEMAIRAMITEHECLDEWWCLPRQQTWYFFSHSEWSRAALLQFANALSASCGSNETTKDAARRGDFHALRQAARDSYKRLDARLYNALKTQISPASDVQQERHELLLIWEEHKQYWRSAARARPSSSDEESV